MKKTLWFFALFAFLAFIFIASPLTSDPAERQPAADASLPVHSLKSAFLRDIQCNLPEPEIQDKAVSRLPESLQWIDDEAFEGTALRNVQLPENVKQVGDRSFSNITELRTVQVPETLQHIADEAFAGSEQVALTGAARSELISWAKEKGYRYFVIAALREKQEAAVTAIIAKIHTETGRIRQTGSFSFSDFSKERRSGRPAAELKSEKYQGKASVYVQSRYFP